MDTKIQRFDFGSLRDFRQPFEAMATPIVVEEELPEPLPPPVFDENELQAARDAAREAGFNEGFQAGSDEVRNQQDQLTIQSQQALHSLTGELHTLEARYAATLAHQSQTMAELALVIAKKVAGKALQENAVAEIQQLVENCLPVVMGKPRLIIELHPEVLPVTETQLRDYLAGQHYEGELICRPNANLAPHDVRIDWEQGHAERSTEVLWQEIMALMQKIPLNVTLEPPLAAIANEPTTQTMITGD